MASSSALSVTFPMVIIALLLDSMTLDVKKTLSGLKMLLVYGVSIQVSYSINFFVLILSVLNVCYYLISC